jgi:hypothetical protein
VGPGIERDHGGLVEDHPMALAHNTGIRRAEVDGEVSCHGVIVGPSDPTREQCSLHPSAIVLAVRRTVADFALQGIE